MLIRRIPQVKTERIEMAYDERYNSERYFFAKSCMHMTVSIFCCRAYASRSSCYHGEEAAQEEEE